MKELPRAVNARIGKSEAAIDPVRVVPLCCLGRHGVGATKLIHGFRIRRGRTHAKKKGRRLSPSAQVWEEPLQTKVPRGDKFWDTVPILRQNASNNTLYSRWPKWLIFLRF